MGDNLWAPVLIVGFVLMLALTGCTTGHMASATGTRMQFQHASGMRQPPGALAADFEPCKATSKTVAELSACMQAKGWVETGRLR